MKKICVTVITAVLLIIGSFNIVKAMSITEVEQQRAELKAKIDKAGQDIENIEVQLTENLEAINKLDEEIYDYEEKISTITQNLNKIDKQISETEIELANIQIVYDHQEKLLQQRIVCLYEAGSTQYLDVLLNSKNIVDFISRYYLIAEVAQYDRNLLDSIYNQKTKIEELNQSLKQDKQTLKEVKAEQKKLAISLENSKIIRNSYVNKLTKEELKIKEDLALYQNQLDLMELEILLTAMQENGSEYVGGIFVWPAPGYYTITSPYGMRFHPILKVYSVHSGMDIAAPENSYAVAANDGIVTKATYSYSYGNMIMIDHGGGITTLYAHGSELLKQVGDVVKKGDPIMKTGSTGWSTGPHLHFEIRMNGTSIDPYQYLVSNGIVN